MNIHKISNREVRLDSDEKSITLSVEFHAACELLQFVLDYHSCKDLVYFDIDGNYLTQGDDDKIVIYCKGTEEKIVVSFFEFSTALCSEIKNNMYAWIVPNYEGTKRRMGEEGITEYMNAHPLTLKEKARCESLLDSIEEILKITV